LLLLVLACTLVLHWRVAVEDDGRKGIIIAYSLLLALLFYVHYVGVFVALGLFAHWLLRPQTRSSLSRMLAAGVLTLLFVSPGIPLLLSQRSLKLHHDRQLALSHDNPQALSFAPSGQDPAGKREISSAIRSTAVVVGFYPATSHLIFLFCAIPLACTLAGTAFLGIVKGDEACRLFLIFSAVAFVAVVAAHLGNTRYLLFLIPVLALALARVLQYWRAQWPRSGAVMGVLVLAGYCAGFVRQVTKPHGTPWQNVVHAIELANQPGDKVVFDVLYSQVPFDYFAQHQNFHPQEAGFPIDIDTWWNMQRHRGFGGPVITQSDLDRFVSDVSRSDARNVWLVLFETYYYDPHDELLERLGQLGQPSEAVLPADPDDQDRSQEDSQIRLIRISRP